MTNKTLNTKGVAARKILKYACVCSSGGVRYVYLVFISVFLYSSSSRLWSNIPHTWGEGGGGGGGEHPSNAAIIDGSALIGPGENSSALFSLISQQM